MIDFCSTFIHMIFASALLSSCWCLPLIQLPGPGWSNARNFLSTNSQQNCTLAGRYQVQIVPRLPIFRLIIVFAELASFLCSWCATLPQKIGALQFSCLQMLPSSPSTLSFHCHQVSLVYIKKNGKLNHRISQVSWQTQPWLRGQSRCHKTCLSEWWPLDQVEGEEEKTLAASILVFSLVFGLFLGAASSYLWVRLLWTAGALTW